MHIVRARLAIIMKFERSERLSLYFSDFFSVVEILYLVVL